VIEGLCSAVHRHSWNPAGRARAWRARPRRLGAR